MWATKWMFRGFVGLACSGLMVLDVASGSGSEDSSWRQWRGPNRDGHVAGTPLPSGDWKPTSSWSIDVGPGHSSPVTDEEVECVFVMTRREGLELVTALDLEAGDELWQDAYDAEIGVNGAATSHGRFPRSTPVYADGRLYTLGVAAAVTCYDAESGDVLWRNEDTGLLDTSKGFCGTSMSPIIDGDRLIVHVGDDQGGRVLSFDTESGDILVSWKGDGPGYASPVITELSGVRQMVTLSDRRVVSFSVPDLELLWSLPFEDKWIENICTPVLHGDDILYAGIRRGSFSANAKLDGEVWKVESNWSNRQEPMYMTSPVLMGDVLVGLSPRKKGEFVALDANDGKVLWKHGDSLGEIASLMVSGENLLVLSQEGKLMSAQVDREGMSIEKSCELGEEAVWAHPLFVPGGVVVKSASHLTRWSLSANS